ARGWSRPAMRRERARAVLESLNNGQAGPCPQRRAAARRSRRRARRGQSMSSPVIDLPSRVLNPDDGYRQITWTVEARGRGPRSDRRTLTPEWVLSVLPRPARATMNPERADGPKVATRISD